VELPEQSDPPPFDIAAAGDRIEALLIASAAGGAVARERAEELVRIVADLYGAGIERILDILHETGRLDDAVLGELAGDKMVSSLLLVHGLHPYDIGTRVEKALESVRPYLGSHGGDVELLDISDDGVVRLRLLGSCDGCPSSSVTLKLAVEGAVEEAAPEVTAIEVEDGAEADTPAKAGPLISLDSLRSRLSEPEAVHGASWEVIPELSELGSGLVGTYLAAGTPIIACRVGTDLFAFRDLCPECGRGMSGATVARRLGGSAKDAVLTCPTCHGHYDVRAAGASLDDTSLHLSPLPLLASGGVASVAVPTSVTA